MHSLFGCIEEIDDHLKDRQLALSDEMSGDSMSFDKFRGFKKIPDINDYIPCDR